MYEILKKEKQQAGIKTNIYEDNSNNNTDNNNTYEKIGYEGTKFSLRVVMYFSSLNLGFMSFTFKMSIWTVVSLLY